MIYIGNIEILTAKSAIYLGNVGSRRAGLISEIDGFDARFFRIPATEADQMDPQQRLLLETAWHAFEDAGLDPHSLKRSRTGVIVGIANDDYARLQGPSGSPIGPYTGLGLSRAVAAGRLAYLFDLRGPAMQIDTTCSSALVSLHLAARELRDGACDLALAGGVNAMLSPETTLGFCEMKALSPTDRLRAFDDAADGYVRGEGCGLLVLRRLGDALERGERIHGVIRGSAVNHDGRTNGLTAPNPGAQAEVISRALEAAGCAAADIHYVEAHGTGTPLGDLIEANGLGAVYGQREHPLRIGSAFYAAFLAGGYDLGPVFRGLGSGVVGRRRAQLSFNSKAFSGAPDWGAYEIFPGLLDSAFHALAAIIGGEQSRSTKLLSVPVELRNVRFSGQAFDAASVEAELAADFAAMPEGAGQVDAGRLAIRDADQRCSARFLMEPLRSLREGVRGTNRLLKAGRQKGEGALPPGR